MPLESVELGVELEAGVEALELRYIGSSGSSGDVAPRLASTMGRLTVGQHQGQSLGSFQK